MTATIEIRARFRQYCLGAGVVSALLVMPIARADQQDPQLEELFDKLQHTTEYAQAARLEARIWQLWVQHPDPQPARLMMQGIEQINRDDLQGALATYDRLVQLTPDFAEAWNKRATVYYLLGNYPASQADIDKTLALEPFHFGALSGRALVHLAQQEYFQARSAFHACLEIYPAMPGVNANLQLLETMLEQRAI